MVGPLYPAETVIEEERTCRATGTRVVLVYSYEADEVQPWETICVTHGAVCSHRTRALAHAWLPHPDEWCEDCMYGPGTMDGTRPLERG